MVRRTRDEAAATRNAILDAAERVFAKRGVSHTSLEDIAQAAGVTRGAIYWHFRNKAEVFTAMVDRVSLPMEDMVARSGGNDVADPLAALKEAAMFVLHRVASDPQCQRVFGVVTLRCEYLEEMSGVRERVNNVKCGCVDSAEKAFANAVKRGLLPKSVSPRLAAVGLDAMIFGLISNWLADRGYVHLERDGAALVERYLQSLTLDVPRAKPAVKRKRKVAA